MLLLTLVSAFAHGQESPARSVYFAGSGNAPLDQHLVQLLKGELEPAISLIEVSEDQLATLDSGPIITVGPAAFSRARQANRSAHILAMLVDKSFISGFAERSPGQITGVLYDVPLIRQALTGKAILPQATKIALLATADSVELYEPLIDELPAYGMSARIFLVDSNDKLIPTLVRALGYGDFLLAAPDSAIYNPRTIKHILLTAYRRNQIVIGPTQAYVKAGSLASSYAPFPEMVELANDFLERFFESGQFPEPSYPEHFRVEVNAQVARSLNIPLPSREDIATRVDRQLTVNGEVSDE
ncbi:ABC transporter substrate-binding protein [Marinobacter maroccanus]|uniref:ABC transporter substrate-binding protein n=1 Tax=Marinobacter maroccanus TaxID=2055143 RepID=UPI001F53EFC9|nr:ABC transporter substrate-binding protein [Marinobacter maroccanus]